MIDNCTWSFLKSCHCFPGKNSKVLHFFKTIWIWIAFYMTTGILYDPGDHPKFEPRLILWRRINKSCIIILCIWYFFLKMLQIISEEFRKMKVLFPYLYTIAVSTIVFRPDSIGTTAPTTSRWIRSVVIVIWNWLWSWRF